MSETFQEFCKRILPVVQAGADGKNIDFFSNTENDWVGDEGYGFWLNTKYRVAEPKATPLPITPEMWAMIDPKYRLACMDDHGIVWFSHAELEWRGHYWACFNSPVDGRCKSPLNIDTTGIIPELSLTKRPDVVVNDAKDSGSSKEEVREWLTQEVKGGVFDPELTKRTIDEAIKKSDEQPALDGDDGDDDSLLQRALELADKAEDLMKRINHSERVIHDAAAGINGADYVITEYRNPMTGITQTIQTKIK